MPHLHRLASRFSTRAALVAAIAVTLNGAVATSALAEDFTVTRTDDPSPAHCDPGNCSLREAVNAADNNGPGANDRIILQGGQTYTLQQPASGNSPSETGGALIVLHSIDIVTSGQGNAVINGNGATTGDRVFDVMQGTLELHQIVVSNGTGVMPISVGSRTAYGGGGVLLNGGGLYMFDGALEGNSVSRVGDIGGAISNYDAHVLLQRVLVTQNRSEHGWGGGVFTGPSGLTDIYDSKFTDNYALSGGALASQGNDGVIVNVIRTELSGNTVLHPTIRAPEIGGAAYIEGAVDGNTNYYFVNSTIDDNAAFTGAGISIKNARATLSNVTMTGNAAQFNGGGISASDDGHNLTSLVLHNSIIAQNTAQNADPDCNDQTGGLIKSHGYNIVGDTTGCVGDLVVHPASGDQLGSSLSPINAKLGPLMFNGGIIASTNALQTGSPAINHGDPATNGCEPVDERTVLRSAGGRCDIGAYELVPPFVVHPLATGIQAHRATIIVKIASYGQVVHFHIEYGRTARYGIRTPRQHVEGPRSVRVAVTLPRLRAGTLYHWRLVATSSRGTRRSVDRTFRTPRS